MPIFLLLPLFLVACSQDPSVIEEPLISATEVIHRCEHACHEPVGVCTMYNEESCIEQCLNVNEGMAEYTRQDVEYFEACIQCHIRQVCNNKFAPDCFPDCLLYLVCPHGGCPYADPNAGI